MSTEITIKYEEPTTIGNYTLGKNIGEGTFGKVKLGTHVLTEEKVAIKILEKSRIVEIADIERVAREIHILRRIKHPHIIQLYEIIETPEQIFLIMEYASGGELYEYIVERNKLEEKEACKFFQQIIAGVRYLHKHGIVHRDLKPENLLLDNNKNIKIVDFGLSNTYRTHQTLKTACGSPSYAAPEMVAGKDYIPMKVDVWSSGITLYALLCGYLPFEDPHPVALYKKILNGDFIIPKFVSAKARDLIRGTLNSDPEGRLNFDEIVAHPWLQQCSDITDDNKNPSINTSILEVVKDFGFEAETVKQYVLRGKHNHLTAT